VAAVEHGDDVEELAGPEISQHVLAAFERQTMYPHHTSDDEVHRLAGFAFRDDHLARRESALVDVGRDLGQVIFTKPSEERQLRNSFNCSNHQHPTLKL